MNGLAAQHRCTAYPTCVLPEPLSRNRPDPTNRPGRPSGSDPDFHTGTAGATSCWRPAGSASPARKSAGRAGAAPEDRASSSGRSGRKTYELEIAGKLLRELGVRERVARSRDLVAAGLRLRGGGACAADQPPGALPDTDAEDGAAAASAGDPVESRDRRGGAREPDRRLPDGDRLCQPAGSGAGQPQAGATGDAGAEADPAPPPARATQAARLLPRRAAAAAVAARHDLDLGRRARLDAT